MVSEVNNQLMHSGACLAAVPALGLLATIVSSCGPAYSVTARPSPGRGSVPCTLSDLPMLPQQALEGFTVNVSEEVTNAPIKGVDTSAGPVVTDYRDGRLKGYLANVAISGPDRASEDAWARIHNYPLQRLPYVPLSGAVVAHASRILEMYEFVAVYDSPKGAGAFVAWLTQDTQRVNLHGLVTGTASVTPPQPGPDPPYETDYRVVKAANDVVVRLDFEGPSRMGTAQVASLANTAIQRALGACE